MDPLLDDVLAYSPDEGGGDCDSSKIQHKPPLTRECFPSLHKQRYECQFDHPQRLAKENTQPKLELCTRTQLLFFVRKRERSVPCRFPPQFL